MTGRTLSAEPVASGVLVVDKPAGPTSHDVVDRVRRAFGVRRVGHTGTLDPFATGVLPVCVGKATRLARFLTAGEKSYRAGVRLGFATDTDDRTGEPSAPPRPVAFTRERIEEVCRGFLGAQAQVPPAFSAKRRGGRRLYELARAGVVVDREAVPVTIHALEVLEVSGERIALEVRCSAGTYIRALARDIGATLGVGGHLERLQRTASGPFGLEQAVGWDEIPNAAGRLVPLNELLPEMPTARVGEEGVRALRHGRDLGRALVEEGFPAAAPSGLPQWVRVMDGSGRLLGLAVPRGFSAGSGELPVEPVLHPELVLAE